MKLENQVVRLELAKKLKDLGVNQESLFYWAVHKEKDKAHIQDDGAVRLPEYNYYSAFTVAELGEMLPSNCVSYRTNEVDIKEYLCCQYVDGDWSKYHNIIPADTEADARAKMLIYLLENKLITL